MAGDTSRCSLRGETILTFFENALSERITGVAAETGTHGSVTDDIAVGASPAGSSARIFAFLIDTGQLAKALAIANAFGTTVWWTAREFWQTGAGRRIVDHLTLRVRATG